MKPPVTVPKDIVASFVGSNTHIIRQAMMQNVPPEYAVLMKPQWTEVVPDDEAQTFEMISARSKFVLCPRGYAATSVRMYEAFQHGAVPVYISDEFITPWDDEIDWDKLVLKVAPADVERLTEIIEECSDENWEMMADYGKKIYSTHFSMEAVFNKIIETVRR